jgi:heme-degrading monooxygenase HmoA
MYARMSRFAGLPPEQIDPTLEGFETEQLPQLEQQPGYKGVLVMADRGQGKAVAITFWETDDDLKASERVAGDARHAAMQAAGPVRDPVVERHEVLLQNVGAGSGV